MASRLDVSVSGPLFDGQASAAVRAWLDDTVREVAHMAVLELDAVVMDKTGRGTGHYQSMIRTRFLPNSEAVVDDPVVYGNWLEGVSKRNESTRFKGYHLWRRTRMRLRRTFKPFAQKKLDEYIGRMGGHVA